MPELPEVETSRRGIEPHLVGATILHAVVRNGRLRWPVSEEIYRLSDQPVLSVQRRAKYLLLELPEGWIIIHLGMSGSLRILPEELPPEKQKRATNYLFAHRVLHYFLYSLLCFLLSNLYFRERYRLFYQLPISRKIHFQLFLHARNNHFNLPEWYVEDLSKDSHFLSPLNANEGRYYSMISR